MRNIIIYNLTFKRTARFAPEEYEVLDASGKEIAYVRLRSGILTLVMTPEKLGSFTYHWEIPDLNMFHTQQRRENWLLAAANKILEVREKYAG